MWNFMKFQIWPCFFNELKQFLWIRMFNVMKIFQGNLLNINFFWHQWILQWCLWLPGIFYMTESDKLYTTDNQIKSVWINIAMIELLKSNFNQGKLTSRGQWHTATLLNSCSERLCKGIGQTLRKDDSCDSTWIIYLWRGIQHSMITTTYRDCLLGENQTINGAGY